MWISNCSPTSKGGGPPAQRKADVVVMLKLDRMFRNATDYLAIVETWDKADVSLHVVDLGGNAIDVLGEYLGLRVVQCHR